MNINLQANERLIRHDDAALRYTGRTSAGSAGAKVVIEEMLVGEEASILALCDGKTIIAILKQESISKMFA